MIDSVVWLFRSGDRFLWVQVSSKLEKETQSSRLRALAVKKQLEGRPGLYDASRQYFYSLTVCSNKSPNQKQDVRTLCTWKYFSARHACLTFNMYGSIRVTATSFVNGDCWRQFSMLWFMSLCRRQIVGVPREGCNLLTTSKRLEYDIISSQAFWLTIYRIFGFNWFTSWLARIAKWFDPQRRMDSGWLHTSDR